MLSSPNPDNFAADAQLKKAGVYDFQDTTCTIRIINISSQVSLVSTDQIKGVTTHHVLLVRHWKTLMKHADLLDKKN